MEQLIEYIFQFGNLTAQQISFIEEQTEVVELKKGSYFSKAGKTPGEVAFVVDGVFRGWYYDKQGEEVTRCFIQEKSIMCDYINFEAQTASSEYIQACTDSKLLVFSKQSWEELSHIMKPWDAIKSKMVQLCMHQKSRKNPVISQDATTRYLEFLDNHPYLVNRIPLAYVASYLGVTQQSLSRIRKSLS